MAKNKADFVQVVGLDDVRSILNDIIPEKTNNIMRAAVHGIASETAKEAKRRVPVDTGNLKKSIIAKRRKSDPDKPISEVQAQRGKDKKHDGFYWRFVEYGTSGGAAGPQPARPFLQPAVDAIKADMPRVLEEQVKKKLNAAIKKEQKKREKRR